MATILPGIQILLAVLLIAGIIMQNSSSGAGAAFGGSDGDTGFHTRRGFEKTLFNSTIVIAVLFALVSLLIFILS